MDSTLAWTIVGSCAGVAGVAVAAVASVIQSRLGPGPDSKVTAELGVGQLDKTGILCVRFAYGKANIVNLASPEETETSSIEPLEDRSQDSLEFTPVNVILAHNAGHTEVTITDLAGAFRW